jgi:hypothetical protein
MLMGARRLGLVSLVWLGVVGFWGLAVVPAGAAVVHEFLPGVSAGISEGVPAGSGAPVPGSLLEITSMAADSGEVYVADSRASVGGEQGGQRLDKFDASSGAFVSYFPPAPESFFHLNQGLAVGHATGEREVYVEGEEAVEGAVSGVVAVFTAAGSLQGVWRGTPGKGGPQSERFGRLRSAAVDDSGGLSWAAGDVYVADQERGVVDVFKPSAGGGEEYVTRLTGTEPGVPFAGPVSVAVNQSNDEVLVADGGVVDIFKPAAIAGQYELAGTLTGTPSAPFNEIRSVVVDGGNGDIYVTQNGGTGVDQFDAAGGYLGRLSSTPAGPFGLVTSVAVDPVNHHVYVGTVNQGTHVYAVDVFGESMVVPDVVTGEASGVQPASVTLNGTVNPDAIQVSDCHFEYGTSSAYGQSAPCVPAAAAIPADSSVHAVSADVSGLTPGRVYHFRLVAGNANGVNEGRDRIFGPPTIDEQSSAAPTQNTVALGAQVNPDAVDTTCHFQYVEEAHYDATAADPYAAGVSVPCTPLDLGAATSDQAASTELTALRAGVTYHWRVVVVNAAGTADGGDQAFTTVPPAQIADVSATDATSASVTLHAQINPLGNDTTYRFEYGTSTAYGASIPAPDADIGAGTGYVSVSQHITGLRPNTTYHYRAIASNTLGTATSADHTFVYATTGGGLPDGRAYEMVTPPHKNGALVGDVLFGLLPAVSGDGSRVIASTIQCFAGAVSCNAERNGQEGTLFAFSRTSGGWVASSLAPPATRFLTSIPDAFSADSGSALLQMPTPPFGEDDLYARGADGSLVDVGPTTPPAAGPVVPNAAVSAATADLSRVLWQATNQNSFWPFDSTQQGGPQSLYEYVGDGSPPVLVGVSGGRGSTALIGTCGVVAGGPGGTAKEQMGVLSGDGRTVFFTVLHSNGCVGPAANGLYARVDESRTVAVSGRSAGDCTGVCLGSPAGDAQFQGASVDGSRVFFTSTQQLTNSASEDSHPGDSALSGCPGASGVGGCNLYEYDFANPAGHELVDVSAGDSSGGGPRVQGVVAAAPDGSHVYFVARGVLSVAANAQGQHARNGADNLYVFERDQGFPAGRVAFIASLPDNDRSEWGSFGKANVTPDGRFLVFLSGGRLTSDDVSASSGKQVFRYDAQSGQLVRISAGEEGFNDNGNSATASTCEPGVLAGFCADEASIVPVQGSGRVGFPRSDPSMSDDGSYVFFQSPVALTRGALDDVRIGTTVASELPVLAQNVYEWHAGHVYLISDGRDVSLNGGTSDVCSNLSATCLLGADRSGANVFFATADPLVAQDTDTELDYYDARVCTSSDPCVTSPVVGVACQGEACHGTPGGAPVAPGAGTVAFSGPGNLAAPLGVVVHRKHVVRKKRRRRAKHTRRGAHAKKRARRAGAGVAGRRGVRGGRS